ncbi:hypothetical protein C8Q74DRAFT_116958 [Fomes fomentarius]|nr:hypothetical protein C8Q74DRAFT_116958 [Fomes fomentarius]
MWTVSGRRCLTAPLSTSSAVMGIIKRNFIVSPGKASNWEKISEYARAQGRSKASRALRRKTRSSPREFGRPRWGKRKRSRCTTRQPPASARTRSLAMRL